MMDPADGKKGDGERFHPSAEDRNLQELVLKSVDISTFLQELATLAASTLSTGDCPVHCGITVLRHRKPTVAASSDGRARALDELQNGFEEGPCLTALQQREPVLVPDISLERRWPEYAGAALEQGIRFILAIPFAPGAGAEAVLNLYAGRPDALSPLQVTAARNFVANASRSLQLALKLAGLRDTSEDLAGAMRSRATIDMAVGALMAQRQCTQDEATQVLTQLSSSRHSRLQDTAAVVVGGLNGAPAKPE